MPNEPTQATFHKIATSGPMSFSVDSEVFVVRMHTIEQMAFLLDWFDKFAANRPCWQRYCVHCSEPIGTRYQVQWNGAPDPGWIHHPDDGPDAYTYCGDEYGTEAEPVPVGRKQ